MNPKVSAFTEKHKNRSDQLEKLRSILLDCMLTEDYKWNQRCYSAHGGIVVAMNNFKNYSALMFFKGSLLKDTDKILIKPGENSQAMRQLRFTDIKEIEAQEAIIKRYIIEAIEIEKAGLKVDKVRTEEMDIPEEFQIRLNENNELKKAFQLLTPGRKRAYLMYFSGAKQSKTRYERIENNIKRILAGKGPNECICGLSKRLPLCDGSHKKDSIQKSL